MMRMESAAPNEPVAPAQGNLSRCQKLLQQEVLACEDPICCCEAEPRWLRFEQEHSDPANPSEWESTERPSGSDL